MTRSLVKNLVARVVASMPEHVVDAAREDLRRTGFVDWVWLEENLGRELEDAGYTMQVYLDEIDAAKLAAELVVRGAS